MRRIMFLNETNKKLITFSIIVDTIFVTKRIFVVYQRSSYLLVSGV